jgi:hypothetical protein
MESAAAAARKCAGAFDTFVVDGGDGCGDGDDDGDDDEHHDDDDYEHEDDDDDEHEDDGDGNDSADAARIETPLTCAAAGANHRLQP